MAQQPRAHTALVEAQSSVPVLGSLQPPLKLQGNWCSLLTSAGMTAHLQSNAHAYTDIHAHIIKR